MGVAGQEPSAAADQTGRSFTPACVSVISQFDGPSIKLGDGR